MTKKAIGRPTTFKAEYVEQGRQLAMLGTLTEDMHKVFGVGHGTFRRWLLRYPHFRTAINDGRDAADARVAMSLYSRAMGYSHEAVKIFADPKTGCVEKVPYIEHYPPDTAACIFWLKNRQRARWRDKVDQEITGADGGPVQVEAVPTSALDAFDAKLAQILDAKQQAATVIATASAKPTV